MTARAGRLAVPESALAVLADHGAPLTSAGRPGRAIAPAEGVRGVVRTLPPDAGFSPDNAQQMGGPRDVLLTLRGAVALAPGQRVVLGAGSDAATFAVQGPAPTRGPEWDGWAVVEQRVRGGAA